MRDDEQHEGDTSYRHQGLLASVKPQAGVTAERPTRRRRYGRPLLLAALLGGGAAACYLARRGGRGSTTGQQEQAMITRRPGLSIPEPTAQSGDPQREEHHVVPGTAVGEQRATKHATAEALPIAQERQAGREAQRSRPSETTTARQAAPLTTASPPPPMDPTAHRQERGATEPAPIRASHAELAAQISAHMTVVDNNGVRVGAVDRVEGAATIRLTKDGQGRHHWVPLTWVTRVDTHVHLDRSGKDARQAWRARRSKGR